MRRDGRPLDVGRVARSVAVALLLSAAAARADGIRVSVDRPEATLEDQLVLQITVEGSQTARPDLPPLEAFEVASAGRSNQMQIVNGRVSSSVTYTFVLTPKRVGHFVIGSATVEIGDRRYASEPFAVRILPPSAEPRQSRALFLTAEVSSRRPFVSQQVVFVWRFYRQIQVADARLQAFEFPGFQVEELGDTREYEATVGGQRYLVSEVRRALFPLEAGARVIPETRLAVETLVREPGGSGSLFDEFFARTRTRTKILRTEPIELEVRALPPAPDDFSGLVGQFDVRAQLSRSELAVGESATWTVTVSGSGNAQMIPEPTIPEPAGAKVYADRPASTLKREAEGLRGSRTFSRALVPLAAGRLRLPSIALTFFDPEKELFRTVRSRELVLDVTPAPGREQAEVEASAEVAVGKLPVRILADDILPLRQGGDALAPDRPPSVRSLIGGLIAPPVVFLLASLLVRRRRRLTEDPALRWRRAAARRARRTLRTIHAATLRGDRREAARLGSRCLREFVGNRLGLAGTSFTVGEVTELLRQQGCEESVIERVRAALDELEAAQYAPATDIEIDRSRIAGLLEVLERCL